MPKNGASQRSMGSMRPHQRMASSTLRRTGMRHPPLIPSPTTGARCALLSRCSSANAYTISCIPPGKDIILGASAVPEA